MQGLEIFFSSHFNYIVNVNLSQRRLTCTCTDYHSEHPPSCTTLWAIGRDVGLSSAAETYYN